MVIIDAGIGISNDFSFSHNDHLPFGLNSNFNINDDQ